MLLATHPLGYATSHPATPDSGEPVSQRAHVREVFGGATGPAASLLFSGRQQHRERGVVGYGGRSRDQASGRGPCGAVPVNR
jgi:hypothetical protein